MMRRKAWLIAGLLAGCFYGHPVSGVLPDEGEPAAELAGLVALLAIPGAAGVDPAEQNPSPDAGSAADCSPEASGFAGGVGNTDAPYQICSADMLQLMANDLAAHYVLTSDIDASATATWNGGLGFEPVGSPGTPFTGTLDGGYFSINGLTIQRPAASNVSLFGVLDAATVRRLRLTNAEILGQGAVGGIAGRAQNGALLQQVAFLNGTITANGASVGAMAGQLVASQLIECYASGSIANSAAGLNRSTGGLVGLAHASGMRVDNCAADVTVSAPAAESKIGGAIGHVWDIGGCTAPYAVTNVYAVGSVTAAVGPAGLFGQLQICDAQYVYCLDTSDPTGQCAIFFSGTLDDGGPRTAAALECATGPDSTCAGPLTFEGWSTAIWNFGDGTQRPWPRWMGAPP